METTPVIIENNGSLPHETLPDNSILNPQLPMKTKMKVASEVAECLKEFLETQKLIDYTLNKKDPEKGYVLVEGWEVLGTMLGIVPETKIVEEMKNEKNGRTIGFKARATLYLNPIVENGEIVGGTMLSTAEAYATRDGFQKEFFSMASMAQTRALGKAYRMALSWIIKMAGYEPTPAEDMPGFGKQNFQKKPDLGPAEESTKPDLKRGEDCYKRICKRKDFNGDKKSHEDILNYAKKKGYSEVAIFHLKCYLEAKV